MYRGNTGSIHKTRYKAKSPTTDPRKVPQMNLLDAISSPPTPPNPLQGGGGSGTPETSTPQPSEPRNPREPVPVYRWRVVGRCPCCLTAWVIDIDSPEDPVASWPDPRKMSDALLCGSCQARKRVLFRDGTGRTVSLWTPGDVGIMIHNLEDPQQDFHAMVRNRSKGVVPDDAPAPIDDIERVLDPLRRLSVVGEGFLRSVGLDWSKYIRRASQGQSRPQKVTEDTFQVMPRTPDEEY